MNIDFKFDTYFGKKLTDGLVENGEKLITQAKTFNIVLSEIVKNVEGSNMPSKIMIEHKHYIIDPKYSVFIICAVGIPMYFYCKYKFGNREYDTT
jgi:hypothetical protein